MPDNYEMKNNPCANENKINEWEKQVFAKKGLEVLRQNILLPSLRHPSVTHMVTKTKLLRVSLVCNDCTTCFLLLLGHGAAVNQNLTKVTRKENLLACCDKVL